ncbi:hypothetical protein U1Q18_023416, partial [Sarracenia purpurea var. burkii]
IEIVHPLPQCFPRLLTPASNSNPYPSEKIHEHHLFELSTAGSYAKSPNSTLTDDK